MHNKMNIMCVHCACIECMIRNSFSILVIRFRNCLTKVHKMNIIIIIIVVVVVVLKD